MSDWISINDCPPDPEQVVLAIYKSPRTGPEHEIVYGSVVIEQPEYTHWMQLPPLPKE